jgi:hypothetical protein
MALFSSVDSWASASHLLAYLDPGTGSMAFQILVASLLSTSFFLKTWVRQLLRGSRS